MNIYIILYWFWEGDSHLVNSFCDVVDTEEEAITIIKQKDKCAKIFLSVENIPNEEDGSFGDDGFYQILRRQVGQGLPPA